MFRIGDFSRIARVSARLLRFYDEIGLFVPAHADPQSGYRFYTVAQLSELNRILVLKELGFNLDQVRAIVSKNVDPAELRNMLLLRNTSIGNFFDLCAISLPINLGNALPCGLMLFARHGNDRKLFEVAAAVEKALNS